MLNKSAVIVECAQPLSLLPSPTTRKDERFDTRLLFRHSRRERCWRTRTRDPPLHARRAARSTPGPASSIHNFFSPQTTDSHAATGGSPALTHILVETVGGKESTLDASKKVIAGNLLLNASRDLQLVRRGKRLPWESNLYIEALVWRTTPAYESGLAFAFERQQGSHVPPAPEKLAVLEADLAYFYHVETRLGQEYHSWESFAAFDDPSTMPVSRGIRSHSSFPANESARRTSLYLRPTTLPSFRPSST